MSKLWMDTETFCTVPIRNGTHAYAEQAEIILFAWAIDDGPAAVWDCTTGEPIPAELEAALLDPEVEVWAHNSHFDRTVMRHAMPDLCPPLHRWRDTMIQATSHSLPGALGDLSKVMGLGADTAKDADGKRLIRLFCIPQPEGRKLAARDRETDPEDWAKFVEYARLDIVAMRAVHKKLPKWNYPNMDSEVALWHLDQAINDRGVQVDMELVKAALVTVAEEQKALADRTVEVTEGVVQAATQRNAMLKHLAEAYDFHLDDLKGSTLERKLEDPTLDAPVRELLRLRLQASTSSTAKFKAFEKIVSRDSRARGLLQFNGASRTGRWAGRGVQPQNFSRGVLHGILYEEAVEAIKGGYLRLL